MTKIKKPIPDKPLNWECPKCGERNAAPALQVAKNVVECSTCQREFRWIQIKVKW